jgi:hypothetical protein
VAAENLGIIELIPSRIRTGDEKPAHRVAQSRPPGAIATPKVAGVLMQQRGENALRQYVFYGEISIGCTESLGVTLYPLPEGRISIRSLSDSRKDGGLEEYSWICRVSPGNC